MPRAPQPVYDPEDEKPIVAPNLKKQEEASQTPAELLERIPTMSDEQGRELDKRRGLDSADLAKIEDSAASSAHPNQVGRGFVKNTGRRGGFLRSPLRGASGRRKTLLISLAVVLASVAAAAVIFFTLLPWKLLHTVTNIQNHFFSATENAQEKATDRLVQGYIRTKVFPKLSTCNGRVVDRRCRVVIPPGGNPVTNLYRAWAEARFELKLYEKYGIEFAYDGQNYRLKAPGLTERRDSKGVIIDDWARGETPDLYNSRAFASSNEFRNAMKAQISSATEGETRFKKTYYRYKVTRLARAKTGLPLCMIACKSKDNFRDWKKDQKNKAFRLVLTKGVLAPKNEMTRLVVECLFTRGCNIGLQPGAEPELDANGNCLSNCNDNGRARSGFENNIRARIITWAGGPGLTATTELAKAQKLHDEMSSYRSYSQYLVKAAIETGLINAGTSKGEAEEKARRIASQLGNKLPVIGWVLLLGDLAATANYVAENAAKVGHTVNSTGMVGAFQTARVYADECNKVGNCDPDMLGSFHSALGASPNGDTGSTGSAECSPLYPLVTGTEATGTARTGGLGSLFGSKAYAACNYRCEYPFLSTRGLAVCHTERLDLKPIGAQHIENIFNETFGAQVLVKIGEAQQKIIGTAIGTFCKIADVLCDLVGKLLSFFADALKFVPGFEEFLGYLSHIFANYIMPPNPITLNMSGDRTFNMIAAGADVLANESAHATLGGVKLTQAQMSKIVTEQKEARLAQYKSQPFLTRVFDKQSPYSPVSKLAMSMPSSPREGARSYLASLVTNPIGKLLRSFASIFNLSLTPAFAASNPPAGPGILACSDIDDPHFFLGSDGHTDKYWVHDDEYIDLPGTSNDDQRLITYQNGTYSVVNSGSEGNTYPPHPEYCDPGGGDPFGVTQYGYAIDNPIFKEDLEAYYQANCITNDKTRAWNDEAIINAHKITGQPVNRYKAGDKYHGTNPCLLIRAAASSAGAVFDETLLSPEEREDDSSGSTIPPDNDGPVSGDAQQVAQQILSAAQAGRIVFNTLNSADTSDGSTPKQNIEQTANSQPANKSTRCTNNLTPSRTVNLDINLLKFILELSQSQVIEINALAGQCHSTGSRHYSGIAVDFDCPFATAAADRIGARYGVSRNNESCSDPQAPHYHYSVGGR